MTKIRVIGTGEAFASELSNTSYLLQGPRIPTILFDCGYQVPERLWAQKLHLDLDAICLTHLHADHAFGLVPLLARYWEEKRRQPITLFGPRSTQQYLTNLFNLGYPGLIKRLQYSLNFIELAQNSRATWQGLSFTCARTVHSVLNHTVRVDIGRKSFAISGDGQITAATRNLVTDVGILFQEVYTLRTPIPVHADLVTVEKFIATASLGRIGIAHQSRSEITKFHRKVETLRKNDSRWFILKPGMTVPIEETPLTN